MKKFIKSSISFLLIVLFSAIVCMIAGLAVCTLWSCQAGVSVFFFGSILMCVALGAFD